MFGMNMFLYNSVIRGLKKICYNLIMVLYFDNLNIVYNRFFSNGDSNGSENGSFYFSI